MYRDERGRVLDFHAMRRQFISNLVRGGAHPKEAQTLARHSTITLTMDYYAHLQVGDPKTRARMKTTSKKWWGRFRDADGREKRVPLVCDKAAAQRMLSELVTREERKTAGVIDRFDDHRTSPLAKHVADYCHFLKSKGDTTEHVDRTAAQIKKVFADCRFKSIQDLSASRVAKWLGDLRAKGRGPRTSNAHLTSIRGFSRWLAWDRRAREDVFSQLVPMNIKVDVRRQRRTLTADGIARLITAAKQGELFRGLSGPERAVLYHVALNTGLRASELASLTMRSFDLESHPPTVTVEAGYSKHRRRDVLPIRADLANIVKNYICQQARSHGERLWSGTWSQWGAALMIRKDLAAAREEWIEEAKTAGERTRREATDFLTYRDERGRVFDFHAMRHQFISNLVRGGAHPKEAQTLARHSTITLTMDYYTHLQVGDLTAALERLPPTSAT